MKYHLLLVLYHMMMDYRFSLLHKLPDNKHTFRLNNNKIYFSKNGVWANGSGAWGSSTFDSGVGGQTIASGLTFFGFSPNESTWEVNFGNGYFGTTAISSAGTNASNIGSFEYDVPTGYTALTSKGLNE